jgi:hypothetical protein
MITIPPFGCPRRREMDNQARTVRDDLLAVDDLILEGSNYDCRPLFLPHCVLYRLSNILPHLSVQNEFFWGGEFKRGVRVPSNTILPHLGVQMHFFGVGNLSEGSVSPSTFVSARSTVNWVFLYREISKAARTRRSPVDGQPGWAPPPTNPPKRIRIN